jgi:hypothetical protein
MNEKRHGRGEGLVSTVHNLAQLIISTCAHFIDQHVTKAGNLDESAQQIFLKTINEKVRRPSFSIGSVT